MHEDRPTCAAIDCGTNSTRLLVARPEAAGPIGVRSSRLTTLVRRNAITRLGQGVDAGGHLASDAIARVVTVLEDYATVLAENGVAPDRIRMTATSAARDAGNREEFFAAAEAVIGVRPELLSGDEEARLSWLGATTALPPTWRDGRDPDDLDLVVDIGGGSTEFAVGRAGEFEPHGTVSVDIGCVRITEKFLHGDPPTAEELSQAISVVRDHLDDVSRDLAGVGAATRLVGLAGTITTVAAVEIGLVTYARDQIHHYTLTRDAVEDVFRTLATESRADRIHNPGLESGRADVVVGGCIVLVALLRHLGFNELLVSESDILDGLAATIAARPA